MKHFLIALGLCFPMTASAPMNREFGVKIIEVEKHWNTFIRSYFGCPPDGEMGPETCKPNEGKLDYGAYMKWGKAVDDLRKNGR